MLSLDASSMSRVLTDLRSRRQRLLFPVLRRANASAAFLQPPGLTRLSLPHDVVEELRTVSIDRGPAAALECLVGRGKLRANSAQTNAIAKLQDAWKLAQALHAEVAKWRIARKYWEATCATLRKQAEMANGKDAKAVVIPPAPLPPNPSTQGCYFWGDVGVGKSLLMDIFCVGFTGGTHGVTVKRMHFHEFMLSVHQYVFALRGTCNTREALQKFASDLAVDTRVLCFDEFQLTNIADVLMIKLLFEALFAHHLIAVVTSNRPPQELYKGGLNHMIYMPPFLDLLGSRLHEVHLDSGIDFRRETYDSAVSGIVTRSGDFLICDRSGDEQGLLESAFTSAAGHAKAVARDIPLAWGRTMLCSAVAGGVAKFSFHELCGSFLSADDYLAIVDHGHIHTFVVAGVHRFEIGQHNAARRFTNLIDVLYERQCRLICTATAPPDDLLESMQQLSIAKLIPAHGMGLAASEHLHNAVRRHNEGFTPRKTEAAFSAARVGAGDMVLRVAESEDGGIFGVMEASLSSVQESGFGARRCASRLQEMNSEAWLRAHASKWLKP